MVAEEAASATDSHGGGSSSLVSVSHRLATEHSFPAAVEDAFAATEWVTENAETFAGKADRIAVAGNSSGGNLAAVVTLMARNSGGPDIDYQLLIYPKVSYTSDGPLTKRTTGISPHARRWSSSKISILRVTSIPGTHTRRC